ncbi:hypothetical protein V5E97_38100 [Singulisphaera sp. Ch08]|uniref:Glycosyltransferase RgtA/B/C/D-like domain-containing protein n=1 Tax=Singulisphaera sp. Ch08 TaxID=3120278 RepID=A0AAU7CEZ7_9BACT
MPDKLGGLGDLLILLLLAWCPRIVLVLRGGQCYFPDETRYFQCWGVLKHLACGELGQAGDAVVDSVAHCFYTVICCVPAVAQCVVARLAGRTMRWVIIFEWLSVSTLILSLASVACIGLTYAIARRAGGDRREGLTAALIMACSSSMFYYARHLLPYDTSMALALLALWIGLADCPGLALSVLTGAVAGLAFLTYYGYWLIAAAAMAIHVLRGLPSGKSVARRGLAAGLGFVAPIALLILIAVARGSDLPSHLVNFSGTVTQGDFSEGWSLPWAYLWHAEHGLLLVWTLGAPLVLLPAARANREASARARGLHWLGLALSLYLVLVTVSTVMEKMVVYGRLVRQVVPFLCLGTACAVTRLLNGRPIGRSTIVATGLLMAQAAFNFGQPLAMRYPGEVLRQVTATYGPVARGLTFVGPLLDEGIPDDPFRSMENPGARPGEPVPARRTGHNSSYLMLNTQFLYPIHGHQGHPRGETILRIPHPEGFLPYQYEGLGVRERALLRTGQTVMELIDTHGRP